MDSTKWSRGFSLFIVAALYALALAAGAGAYLAAGSLSNGVLLRMLLAVVAATLVIWLSGVLLKNSSTYDPYWSVIPVFIAAGYIALSGAPVTFAAVVSFTAILVWSVRLTYNWVKNWGGMAHQDFRYTDLKAQSPKLWFVTNLFGINLMPTLSVFAGMIPYYYLVNAPSYGGFGYVLVSAGALLCVCCAALQFTADLQMYNFRKTAPKGSYIDVGLWRYSRHPNYLGEVFFWVGVFIMGLPAFNWLSLIGPVWMAALFLFISIPMMEKHILKSRPAYAAYQKEVSAFLPMPRKKPAKRKFTPTA
jgi:steroid 5-alpha reductase family enzyme